MRQKLEPYAEKPRTRVIIGVFHFALLGQLRILLEERNSLSDMLLSTHKQAPTLNERRFWKGMESMQPTNGEAW